MDTQDLKLIKYQPADVDGLYAILVECGQDMFQRYGLSHWHPPYPIEVMRKNAALMDVFAVLHANEVVGTLTAGSLGWRYENVPWADAAHRPFYLYKLAIRPVYQGRGWGSWCLRQVESLAVQHGCQALRFDAIAKHTVLCAFYRKLGYEERGRRTTRDFYGADQDVVFFEKVLQV